MYVPPTCTCTSILNVPISQKQYQPKTQHPNQPTMGLIIHHLGHSQSDRVVFLCEELKIPYELKKYNRSPIFSPPELQNLHPIGAAPVIQDDDGKVLLAESEACIEYISNIYGQGRLFVPPGAKNYADFLFYYHITNGTLQPAIGRVMALRTAGLAEENPMLMRYVDKVHQVLAVLDQRVAEKTWLAGEEFSAADIMVIFALTTFREFCAIDLSRYGDLMRYVRRIVERPAYQSYLKKADPDIEIERFVNGPPPPLHPALQAMMIMKKKM